MLFLLILQTFGYLIRTLVFTKYGILFDSKDRLKNDVERLSGFIRICFCIGLFLLLVNFSSIIFHIIFHFIFHLLSLSIWTKSWFIQSDGFFFTFDLDRLIFHSFNCGCWIGCNSIFSIYHHVI